MLRAIVIDDEKHSRELLCKQISDLGIGIKVVNTAFSVKTGYEIICSDKPDLVFLDVELGDGSGFELLDMFQLIHFRIIIITAFPNYALKAFKISAIDYLLKPVNIKELREACLKVKLNGSTKLETGQLLYKNNNQTSLVIPHLKGFEILKMKEIIICKADGYCTNFHLTGKRKIASSKNLKHYEGILDEMNFIRVHHSYIININYVTSFSKQGEIRMSEDNIAMLGDVYKERFLKRILNR